MFGVESGSSDNEFEEAEVVAEGRGDGKLSVQMRVGPPPKQCVDVFQGPRVR